MKMSTRGQYALEIAVDLALHLMPDRLESLNDIAKRRNLSEKYLERIMKLLKEAGLVKSVLEQGGGVEPQGPVLLIGPALAGQQLHGLGHIAAVVEG